MNTFSLYTEQETCSQSPPLLFSLDDITGHMGWIWGAGEDQKGYWCTVYTPKETKTLRASSLFRVVQKMLDYIRTTYNV
jgi:hypothetical protein